MPGTATDVAGVQYQRAEYLNEDAEMHRDFIAASFALLNPPKTAMADTGKFSYAYAPLPDILDTVRPILAEHGFALTQPVTGSVGVETILLHRSGQSIRSGVVSLAVPDGDAQKLGSITTYLRRYQLCGLLGIAADEDDDGASASRKKKASGRGASSPKVGSEPARSLGKAPAGQTCQHTDRHDEEHDGVLVEVCDDCGAKRPRAAA